MKLYLIRHGDAESNIGPDRLRKLTPKGKEQSKKIGRYVKNLNPKLVFTSAYIRAHETLKLIISETSWDINDIYETSEANPSGDIDNLLIEIRSYHEESALVVGHNPLLSNLIFKITGEDVLMGNCSFAEIDVGKGILTRFVSIGDLNV